MAKRGKRYNEISQKVDKLKIYTPEEALELLFETRSAKFVETVELAVKLGVDPRHADQQVRGTVVLPNGTGKKIRILAITQGENIEKALKAGATYAGDDEYVAKIQQGWFDFDLVIATPDMMPKLGRLGKILGTKGLMPNPKAGTVTMDVANAIKEIKAGKIEYRLDKANIIHCPVGKASFTAEQLNDNFNTLMDAIVKAKPASAKGQYMKSVTITSTMGPGVKVSTVKYA